MKFDLAFTLVDLGQPWYKGAASEMIRSARLAYKDHEMRVVQITDSKTERHPDADAGLIAPIECTDATLCEFKGAFMAQYALQADRPVIFCDVDLVWNNDSFLKALPGREGVSLLWRAENRLMPYNTGIVGTVGSRQFWTAYQSIVDDLPKEISGWWGDQIAMTIVAAERPDEVIMLPMNDFAPAIGNLPDNPLTTAAVHFKGDRKTLMPHYARLLHQGHGYDFARPSGAKELEGTAVGIAVHNAYCRSRGVPEFKGFDAFARPRPEHEIERLRDERFSAKQQWSDSMSPGRGFAADWGGKELAPCEIKFPNQGPTFAIPPGGMARAQD